tara:strand:- start:612 stop:2153 length:1542 start_codon:yes stop_codon:yes gene_type:complete
LHYLSVKNSILSTIIKKRINKISYSIQNPLETQDIVLKELLKKGKRTHFGNEHNMSTINNYNEFRDNIPIRTYEEIYQYIERIMSGEKNVLWPGNVKWLAKSSGTTNSSSKYIPITNDSLHYCHFKGGKDMLALYTNNFPNRNIYNGKGLMLGGNINKSKTIHNGDLSAILIKEFPFWVSYHRVPDINTALMSNWEEKIEKITNQAIKENITNITGVPSWMLILLKNILQKSNKKNLLELWPNIEVYMHGGVNFKPYKKLFEELIPTKKMNYLEGYNASEGFFAIQDQKNSKGLLLMLDYGIFYEFIEIEKYRLEEYETILLEEVKLSKEYVMVITTNAGLWRYIIGDVIEFVSVNPYRINIIGRTSAYINVFGEEVIVNNTDEALFLTCRDLGIIAKEYTVAPIFINNSAGKHQWLIEFESRPENINLFKRKLDSNLQKLNSDYAAKRSNELIMGIPDIILLEKDEFYVWLKTKGKLGGQHKIPRLSNSRKVIEEILEIKRSFQQKAQAKHK